MIEKLQLLVGNILKVMRRSREPRIDVIFTLVAPSRLVRYMVRL